MATVKSSTDTITYALEQGKGVYVLEKQYHPGVTLLLGVPVECFAGTPDRLCVDGVYNLQEHKCTAPGEEQYAKGIEYVPHF